MLVIDGGFSRPYHLETGIAGYTLVYHSRGFQLVQHEPFESRAKAIEEGLDIKSTTKPDQGLGETSLRLSEWVDKGEGEDGEIDFSVVRPEL